MSSNVKIPEKNIAEDTVAMAIIAQLRGMGYAARDIDRAWHALPGVRYFRTSRADAYRTLDRGRVRWYASNCQGGEDQDYIDIADLGTDQWTEITRAEVDEIRASWESTPHA